MARVHTVEHARKDIKGTDIKKGDKYYWWKFRHGEKQCSKTPPRRSQLTQSSFYATVWDIEDEIGDASADDGLREARDDWASRLREAGEECQGSFENMPEGLQQGETGQLLEERVQAMEAAADELENIELDDPNDDDLELPERNEGESDEDYAKRTEEDREQAVQQYWESKLEELQGVSIEAT